MLIYILKFTACLGIFLAFYKLFLERENMHQFKRFYLLGIVLVSLLIPFITFTTYIEAQPIIGTIDSFSAESNEVVATRQEVTVNYLPIILWGIYGLGLILFGLKFGVNLSQIILKIKNNPKQKSSKFINVLLKDLVTPHTFFSYIFLNKRKYETHQIPQEVLLHEQTHANQKHSIDILFIEFLQVVFWFNPLLYFTRKSIKLNHEFLADEAVLKNGVPANSYQHILLSFSSNQQGSPLANAINYSSIKKRITVMKTQTSKRNIWLRSLVFLPLITLTLYSFSEKKEVTIESNIDKITKQISNPDIELYLNSEGALLHNNQEISVENLHKVTQLEENINISILTSVYTDIELTEQASKSITDYLYNQGLKKFSISLLATKDLTLQDGASRELMREYTRLAKHYNSQKDDNYRIKLKDVERLKYIYGLMSDKQRKSAEPFPDFPEPPPAPNAPMPNLPPPPPPPIPENATKEQKEKYKRVIEEYNRKYKIKDGRVYENPPPPPPPVPENATKAQKEKYKKVIEEYNRKYKVKDGRVYENPPPPPPIPANATPAQKAKYEEAIKMYKVKAEKASLNEANAEKLRTEKIAYREAREAELAEKKGEVARVKEDKERLRAEKLAYRESQNIKPPKPPKSPLDHVVDMAKKDATFFYDGKKVSSDKAISLLKNDSELSISTQNNNSSNPIVNITTNPVITDDNGKVITKVETVKDVKSNTNKDRNGYVEINDKTYFYSIKNNTITYYNRWGKKVNEKGEVIN